MHVNDDQAFEKSVSGNLKDDLHHRRGLAADEYTALCRKAWDGCKSSPDFPFKVLIDPLRSMESVLADTPEEYIHWRVADAIEASREPSTEIRCLAVGPVRPDFSTGPDDQVPTPTEEPENPETRRYILAIFDVLGFSGLLKSKGLNEIMSLYSKLIAEAVTKEAMKSFGIVRLGKREQGSVMGAVPICHAHFSDTVFLWTPLVQHFIAPFMARCADLVCEALKMGLPLRGALAVGPAVLHSRSGTFVGLPIVEAAKLEQAQDWLGVSLGLSMLAADVSREFDPNLVIPYPVPFKKGTNHVPSGLALDWPRRFRSRYGTPPADAIRAIDTSMKHHIYYANAAKFAEFSGGPVFRSDGLGPPQLGELAEAALEARAASAPLSQQHQYMLKDLARAGDVGASVAAFVGSVAAGEEVPEIPNVLPRGMKRYLRELSLASGGKAKFFMLTRCAVDALSTRLCGTLLSQETSDTLSELESFNEESKAVAHFFRDLASGKDLAVPGGLEKKKRLFLKQVQAWVNRGEVPPGLLEGVAEDCLRTRLGEGTLSAYTTKTLAAMEATGRHWADIAGFLRGIAAAEDPPVPADMPAAIRSTLIRVGRSSTMAGVQQPRTLEIISVGFGDPATGVDLFAIVTSLIHLRGSAAEIPKEVQEAIRKFEAGAPERSVIAERLRSVVMSSPPCAAPEGLPVAIRLALMQIEAVLAGHPVPLDPSLVGLAAIRSRHGGGAIGDCMMFSLLALAGANEEARILAEYLWTVANRGPAGPAPVLTEPQMAATAEEVRCLADREVGGMRLLMTRARPSEGNTESKEE
jgi:hypothetical protein